MLNTGAGPVPLGVTFDSDAAQGTDWTKLLGGSFKDGGGRLGAPGRRIGSK